MSTDREHWQVRERYYPTPPQGTYIKMPKTLGRFSTRRLKHVKYNILYSQSMVDTAALDLKIPPFDRAFPDSPEAF